MDDIHLIELFWDRSENAIEETSKKYNRYCSSIAFNILENIEDTEECVNDVYFKTWQAIPDDRPRNFAAYLGKITRNTSINKYNQRRTKKRGNGEVELLLSELEECIPTKVTVEKEIEDGELGKIISDFLRKLDIDNRNIFIRRYFYSDNIVTIAERYGLSESKVKSMLFRSRNKLKIYLEKEGVVL